MGVTAAGVIISEQIYGGKINAGQVAYLKSDGKWYPARANSGATSAGDLAIAPRFERGRGERAGS